MKVRLLGPLVVEVRGLPRLISARRQRLLLVRLALAGGRPVPATRLVEAVWLDSAPSDPRNALQGQVSRLRKVLGSDSVVLSDAGYALGVQDGDVDAAAFERLVEAGSLALRDGDAEEATRTLRRALSLWRGDPLVEFSEAPWAQDEIRRLEQLRRKALEDRVEADLRLGLHRDLIPELEAQVAAEPFEESLRSKLMLALYRCGRQADALRVYADTRTLLADELGLDPTPELQELHSAILSQDPGLAAPLAAQRPRGGGQGRSVSDVEAPEPDAQRVRLLVVDDDPLVRSAVRSILAATDDLEVVGEAEDGHAAIEAAAELRPDIVLIDVRMPKLDGIAATRRLLAEIRPAPRVVVLTTFDQDEQVFRALEAGASGFLLKRSEPAKLIDALRTVARGDAIVDPGVTRQLLRTFVRPVEGLSAGLPHESLDETDLEVLRLLAEGRMDSEIADMLAITPESVVSAVGRIVERLAVRDRTHAVIYAYRHGLAVDPV